MIAMLAICANNAAAWCIYTVPMHAISLLGPVVTLYPKHIERWIFLGCFKVS